MARRASAIEMIKRGREDVLLVDAGGIVGPAYKSDAQDKAATSFAAMQAMGYDAVNFGANDYILALQEDPPTQGKPLPVVMSTLKNPSPGMSHVAPYRIEAVDGLAVGILGVAPLPTPVWEPGGGTTHVTETPEQTLGPVLDSLAGQSDLVLLLSLYNARDTTALMKQFPAIDMAVCAGDRTLRISSPILVGDRPLVQASPKGELLGQLTVTLDDAGRIVESANQLIALGDSIPDDPRIAAIVNSQSQDPGASTPTGAQGTSEPQGQSTVKELSPKEFFEKWGGSEGDS